jgi:hypothetical protein
MISAKGWHTVDHQPNCFKSSLLTANKVMFPLTEKRAFEVYRQSDMIAPEPFTTRL